MEPHTHSFFLIQNPTWFPSRSRQIRHGDAKPIAWRKSSSCISSSTDGFQERNCDSSNYSVVYDSTNLQCFWKTSRTRPRKGQRPTNTYFSITRCQPTYRQQPPGKIQLLNLAMACKSLPRVFQWHFGATPKLFWQHPWLCCQHDDDLGRHHHLDCCTVVLDVVRLCL
jgi:hypothetical protein